MGSLGASYRRSARCGPLRLGMCAPPRKCSWHRRSCGANRCLGTVHRYVKCGKTGAGWPVSTMSAAPSCPLGGGGTSKDEGILAAPEHTFSLPLAGLEPSGTLACDCAMCCCGMQENGTSYTFTLMIVTIRVQPECTTGAEVCRTQTRRHRICQG